MLYVCLFLALSKRGAGDLSHSFGVMTYSSIFLPCRKEQICAFYLLLQVTITHFLSPNSPVSQKWGVKSKTDFEIKEKPVAQGPP